MIADKQISSLWMETKCHWNWQHRWEDRGSCLETCTTSLSFTGQCEGRSSKHWTTCTKNSAWIHSHSLTSTWIKAMSTNTLWLQLCVEPQTRPNNGPAAWVTARNEVFSDVQCIYCLVEHLCGSEKKQRTVSRLQKTQQTSSDLSLE